MPDFKFSCPHCDQHLACDTTLAGRQLTCPRCHHLIRIPTPPGVDPMAVAAESGMTWQTFGPQPIIEQKPKLDAGNMGGATPDAAEKQP